VFLYKEDFNKFIKALTEAVDYVKTDLMPDFDFDAFNHDEAMVDGENGENGEMERSEASPVSAEHESTPVPVAPIEVVASPAAVSNNGSTEEVDKW
jgi:hypothetical protein